MTRTLISGSSPFEGHVGYSRAVRVGGTIAVSGTTATLPDGGHAGDNDAYAQARQALHNIESALRQAGATMGEVIRTRIFVVDIQRDWRDVGRAYGEFFAEIRPSTTMVEVRSLIEDWMLVEIEADAVVG